MNKQPMTTIETMAADVLERNVTIARLIAAIKIGREAVVESFEYADTIDEVYLAEARLRDIDDAIALVEVAAQINGDK